MRFKQQFEFHKVPEWDEYYFNYDQYLEKIEKIVIKMRQYKMTRINSRKFGLSDSFTVTENDEENLLNGADKDALHGKEILVKDDSLNFSRQESDKSEELQVPLISLNTDVKEVIEDFIQECKYIDEFYNREKNKIMHSYEKFYARFMAKLSNSSDRLNLKEDLKEHNLDSLGYSSSWSRQFVEFYSRISWLEGFAKINLIAMQKILLKIDKVILDVKQSKFYHKLLAFIHQLALSKDKGCREERRKIRDSVAKYYFYGDTQKAHEFLDIDEATHKHKDSLSLVFMLGILLALSCLLLFFMFTPAKPTHESLKDVKEIYPIFRCTL